ncbi:hypothetical protein C8R47DRAFT_1316722 [Mycena vitilis]|nr:hypothetical protein C8R47DRAFT_1316722 [Mycena vitilis]
MDHAPPPDSWPATTNVIGHPGAVSSGMFSGAQNFTVTGHTLQNITYAAPAVPLDYRMIPLGDLDLQREIRLDKDTGVVHLRRHAQRHIYSAKLQGQTVTVAMYRGDGAAEKWQQEIGKYMSLRHPNIMQLYGAASWGGMYATVFHGDLIPFKAFLNTYKDFPCLDVFMYGYSYPQYQVSTLNFLVLIPNGPQEAAEYLFFTLEGAPWESMNWIHRATGRLCVELAPEDRTDPTWLRGNSDSFIPLSDSMAMALFAGNAPDIEVLVMDTPLDAYHGVCYLSLSSNSYVNIGTGENVHLGTLNLRPANNAFVEIASLPDAGVEPIFGVLWQNDPVRGEPMENGWTRFNAREVVGSDVDCWFILGNAWEITQFWLSQANYIFKRCQITSNLEDYGLVNEACFKLTIPTTKEVPAGFLLLCPIEDFRIDTSTIGWPTRPAYWSFDPLGTHPLSMEEANKAGFPELQFATRVYRRSCDSSVYAGLRKFHEAKGFDPYSQDVARHLGLPLYQPSGYVDPLFAHVVEDEGDSQDEDDLESQMDVDYEVAETQDVQDLSDMEIDQ